MELAKQQIYAQARKQYTILISTILGQPFSQSSDAMVRFIKACTEYEVLEESNKSVWLAICKTCVPKQKNRKDGKRRYEDNVIPRHLVFDEDCP